VFDKFFTSILTLTLLKKLFIPLLLAKRSMYGHSSNSAEGKYSPPLAVGLIHSFPSTKWESLHPNSPPSKWEEIKGRVKRASPAHPCQICPSAPSSVFLHKAKLFCETKTFYMQLT